MPFRLPRVPFFRVLTLLAIAGGCRTQSAAYMSKVLAARPAPLQASAAPAIDPFSENAAARSGMANSANGNASPQQQSTGRRFRQGGAAGPDSSTRPEPLPRPRSVAEPPARINGAEQSKSRLDDDSDELDEEAEATQSVASTNSRKSHASHDSRWGVNLPKFDKLTNLSALMRKPVRTASARTDVSANVPANGSANATAGDELVEHRPPQTDGTRQQTSEKPAPPPGVRFGHSRPNQVAGNANSPPLSGTDRDTSGRPADPSPAVESRVTFSGQGLPPNSTPQERRFETSNSEWEPGSSPVFPLDLTPESEHSEVAVPEAPPQLTPPQLTPPQLTPPQLTPPQWIPEPVQSHSPPESSQGPRLPGFSAPSAAGPGLRSDTSRRAFASTVAWNGSRTGESHSPQTARPAATQGEQPTPKFRTRSVNLRRAVRGGKESGSLEVSSVSRGQPLILTVALENVRSEKGPTGFLTKTMSTLEIHNPSGEVVTHKYLGTHLDETSARTTELFIAYTLTLPETLPPGDYILRLQSYDFYAGQTSSMQLQIQIQIR